MVSSIQVSEGNFAEAVVAIEPCPGNPSNIAHS